MRDYYEIKAPISRLELPASPTLVVAHSPRVVRRYVETLAYYFKREFDYDFPQFEAAESPSDAEYVPYEAWLFHKAAGDQVKDFDDNPRRVIGAACFRKRSEHPTMWALQWIWFHPYERRRGHLTRSWSTFKTRYGAFEVERPLSDAMAHFLAKH